MSDLSIERLVAAPGRLEAFERVREGLGIYPGSEPVPEGVSCFIAWRGDTPLARASAQIADLRHAPGSSGLIGHYEALEQDAGVAVLDAACRALVGEKVASVLGPMNGSTWARYRLALRPTEEGEPAAVDPPPFLGEPWNPARYAADFAAAGFVEEALYESLVDEHLGEESAGAGRLAESVKSANLRVRPFDLDRFDDELLALFEMSLAAFSDNLYYTPIDFATFRAQYQKLRSLIDPELVLVAEDASRRPVAFLFGFRDPLSPPGAPARVVAKTIATLPAMRGLGLGGHMLDRFRSRAHVLGCGSMIHALIYVQNVSIRMAARHQGHVFRRYALYRWAA